MVMEILFFQTAGEASTSKEVRMITNKHSSRKADRKILLSSCEHGSHVPFEKQPAVKMTIGAFDVKLQVLHVLHIISISLRMF